MSVLDLRCLKDAGELAARRGYKRHLLAYDVKLKGRGMSSDSDSTAATNPAPNWRDLLRHPGVVACRIAILTAIGGLFFVFHGLSFHLTPWSQAFINAIVKHSYPTAGQEDTTVLLFTEDNLRHLGISYPVPYDVHAQVIEALSYYKPRALFVDFTFIDRRKGDGADVKDLAARLCELHAGHDGHDDRGTDIFLAAPTVKPGGQHKAIGADDAGAGAAPTVKPRRQDESVRSELLDTGCIKSASPQINETVGVSGVLTYPHLVAVPGGEPLPSAAFAMAASNVELQLDPNDNANLEIIWGKGVDKLNQKWMNCSPPTFFEALKSTLHNGPLANRLICPYTRTLTVNQLLNTSAGDADIANALTGKTVFYGAGFRFTGDRVDSPVYQEMPGVYLHAMAYDNLATFEKNYKRADDKGWKVEIADWVQLVIASLLLVFFVREPAKAATRPEFIRKLAYPIVVGVAFVLLAGLLGLDDGLLALFVAYFFYRLLIVKDWGFVIQTIVTIAFALIAYFYLNQGPQNVLAFLVFFEVIRHVQKWLKEKSKEYYTLGSVRSEGWSRRFWHAVDVVFSVFSPPADQLDKEHGHDGKHTQIS